VAVSVRIPSYRLHKPSRQAVVTLNGQDIYLGRHNSPESMAEYKRVIAEWSANDKRWPTRASDTCDWTSPLANGYRQVTKTRPFLPRIHVESVSTILQSYIIIIIFFLKSSKVISHLPFSLTLLPTFSRL
jgi:hypothetical protein